MKFVNRPIHFASRVFFRYLMAAKTPPIADSNDLEDSLISALPSTTSSALIISFPSILDSSPLYSLANFSYILLNSSRTLSNTKSFIELEFCSCWTSSLASIAAVASSTPAGGFLHFRLEKGQRSLCHKPM